MDRTSSMIDRVARSDFDSDSDRDSDSESAANLIPEFESKPDGANSEIPPIESAPPRRRLKRRDFRTAQSWIRGWPPIVRYGVALLGTLIAVGLQYQILRLGKLSGMGILYPMAFFVAWYLGFGPALLNILTGAIAVDFFCYEPHFSFLDRNVDVLARLGLFVATAAFVAWVIERSRRSELLYQAAERRSLSSEYRLRTITDRLPAIVSYMGTDRRYRFANRAFADWFGLAPEQIEGRTRASLVGDPSVFAESELHEERAFAGEPSSFEITLDRATGERRSLDVEYLPDVDPATGEVRGIIAVAHDITQRKTAQREAENAKAELHDLFMQTPVGITILKGPEHRYALVNKAHQSILFESERELVGRTVGEALPEIDPEFVRALDRVYATGQPFLGNEAPLDIRRADGSVQRFYVNFVYQPKRDGEGRIDGIITLFYDVTELVLARRKLESAVSARDEFLSIASHELKTPLSSLKLQVQLNQRQLARGENTPLEPARYRQFLDRVDRQIKRLDRLIEDMLDVSRIQAGRLGMEFERVDLGGLLVETIDRMQGETNASGSRITLDPLGGPELVADGDCFRLEQVFLNLISNAIKYGAGRPIRVGGACDGDRVRVWVTDEGMGVAPENRDRIFERFERADSVHGISGLGLGLYIVRTIVDQHGGSIELESQIGRGSTFTVTLPVTRSASLGAGGVKS